MGTTRNIFPKVMNSYKNEKGISRIG